MSKSPMIGTQSGDNSSPLLLRAWAAKFKLQQATEDMNEIIAEFEQKLVERGGGYCSVSIEGIRDGKYCSLSFGVVGKNPDRARLYVFNGKDWTPILNASREMRQEALGAFRELWNKSTGENK